MLPKVCTVSLDVETDAVNDWAMQRDRAFGMARNALGSEQVEFIGGQEGKLGERPHHYGFKLFHVEHS